MGLKCCKLSPSHHRIIVLFPNFSVILPYVPITLSELYESVLSIAYTSYTSYDLMDYFTLTYLQRDKNLKISVSTDKIYSVILRTCSSADIEICCDKKSFLDMYDIDMDIEEHLHEEIAKDLRDLHVFLNSSKERVISFFKAVNSLSAFVGKMSVFMKYGCMKYAITGFLFALAVDSGEKFEMLRLSVKPQNPYIEVSAEGISSNVVDIIRLWNDAMYELRQLKPQVAQMHMLFQYSIHNINSSSFCLNLPDRQHRASYHRISAVLSKGFEACDRLKCLLDSYTLHLEETAREIEKEGIEKILKKISSISSLAMADTLNKSISLFRLRPSNR